MLNLQQLTRVLETLEVPACVCDANDNLIAHNAMGADVEPHSRWQHGEKTELGDGLTLVLLRRANEKAPVAVPMEDISTLANGMAHSIRNPLSSIVTAAELVKDDPNLGEETAMLLGIITKESKHLNQILTDFLNYVRPRPSEAMRVNLCQATRETLRELKRENVFAQSLEIRDELPDELWIEGDETQLRQALWNVLHNASEAMQDGGTLVLRGRLESEKILIEIEDSGRGFSAKELARAFDPFFSNTTEGTGLGLTIARSTIAAMSGTIRAENVGGENTEDEPGGARLCIELPHSPENTQIV